MQIRYWDRAAGVERVEKVYGDRWVEWLYGTSAGRAVGEAILARKPLSRLYGAYNGWALSRRKIEPFIREFGIEMSEFEPGPFRSFNEFFARRFLPGARAFATEAGVLPAPCEARYYAFEGEVPGGLAIKGDAVDPLALLGGAGERIGAAGKLRGGATLVARLCPVDYHRYHYPDDGKTLETSEIPGVLHSVNPRALAVEPRVFLRNERRVALLETRHFGLLAYVEVGAMGVGKIVQSWPESRSFSRGDEKGYFLFGGSTVVVLGEPGRWRPDADLVQRSASGMETFVRLGEGIGRAGGAAEGES